MGCASSAPFLSRQNGETIGPPYELQAAADKLTHDGEDLIGQTKKVMGEVNTDNVKQVGMNIANSAPVENSISGAKESLAKLQETGDAVLENVNSKIHDAGEKIESACGGAGQSINSAVDQIGEKVGSAVSEAKNKIEEYLPSAEVPNPSPIPSDNADETTELESLLKDADTTEREELKSTSPEVPEATNEENVETEAPASRLESANDDEMNESGETGENKEAKENEEDEGKTSPSA